MGTWIGGRVVLCWQPCPCVHCALASRTFDLNFRASASKHLHAISQTPRIPPSTLYIPTRLYTYGQTVIEYSRQSTWQQRCRSAKSRATRARAEPRRIVISRAWVCRAMDAQPLLQAALWAKLQLARYDQRLVQPATAMLTTARHAALSSTS